MNQKTSDYLTRLKAKYADYRDNDSLLALGEIETQIERARELTIYREQAKTQELIEAAMLRIRTCIEKLTDPVNGPKMTDLERVHCFAAMDWARFTLAIVGENPEKSEQVIETIIEGYAKKAGIA